MLAVILNQHLIKKERAGRMQKPRIPPHPTTKQEILFLRRMGFPAQKKMNYLKHIQPKTRMCYGCIIGLMKSLHKGYMITPNKMDLHDTTARKFFRAFFRPSPHT